MSEKLILNFDAWNCHWVDKCPVSIGNNCWLLLLVVVLHWWCWHFLLTYFCSFCNFSTVMDLLYWGCKQCKLALLYVVVSCHNSFRTKLISDVFCGHFSSITFSRRKEKFSSLICWCFHFPQTSLLRLESGFFLLKLTIIVTNKSFEAGWSERGFCLNLQLLPIWVCQDWWKGL